MGDPTSVLGSSGSLLLLRAISVATLLLGLQANILGECVSALICASQSGSEEAGSFSTMKLDIASFQLP